MTSIADSSLTIQASPQSHPAPPCWFGEVTLIASYLRKEASPRCPNRAGALGPAALRARTRSSTLSWCSSATPEAPNGPCKPSTRTCIPMPQSSWPSSTTLLSARRAFLSFLPESLSSFGLDSYSDFLFQPWANPCF